MEDVDAEPHDPPAFWPREAFLSDEVAPGGRSPETLDVTGRARFLFFGPYSRLDRGVWRAKVRLRLCPDAARSRLSVQFGAEPDSATADLEFGRAGFHEVTLEHRFDGAGLAQVRLMLRKAAFHGEIVFSGVQLTRVGDGEPASDVAS